MGNISIKRRWETNQSKKGGYQSIKMRWVTNQSKGGGHESIKRWVRGESDRDPNHDGLHCQVLNVINRIKHPEVLNA